jgi:large subunit ribosomal protein L3
MKAILGKKIGMTQVFRPDGTVVPVTRVQAGPCVVTQVKTKDKDGVQSVQVGFGEQKKFRIKKPQQGHLRDLPTVRLMREIKVDDNHELKRGDTFSVKTFAPGDIVQVVGWAKGRGFQGVVKRHGFHGSPASHGHKDQLRMPGSIGATDAARVFKGKRMAGHMGTGRVTVKNLEIIEVHAEENELLIKGAVPGARGGLLFVSSDEGKIEVEEVVETKHASSPEEENATSKGEAEKDEKEISNQQSVIGDSTTDKPELKVEEIVDKEGKNTPAKPAEAADENNDIDDQKENEEDEKKGAKVSN